MSNNQDTKHNIYWISESGLKNLQNNPKRGVAINIWNSNAKPGTDMWVIADGDNRAPFTKPSLDADADFVFIVDNNTAYFYTWDKGNPNATSLRLVASFKTSIPIQNVPGQWEEMDQTQVETLLNDYYGNINQTSWIKIQYEKATELGEGFINKAIYYNVLKIYGTQNNQKIRIVPGKNWGTLIQDTDGSFSINGQSYKFGNSTGNGDLWHFIEHINNGYGNYFYANLSYEGNCIKYNLYLKPMLHTIQFKKELEKSHNIILNGAPGTGKTYLAHEIAAVMLGKNTWKEVELDPNLLSHVGFVQFHPSYDYTDFVEGLRPTTQRNQPFELLPGIFKTFCEEALKKGYKNDGKGKYETSDEGELVAVDNAKPYIFIIDEINRGEMSKIFGELFFSIDPGYRGKKGKVLTQYANMEKNWNEFDKALNHNKKGQFFVPENVYIIGTMNDIDRSVESMDFAMRRRFKFIEILASKQDSMLRTTFGNDADAVIRRMNNLNLAIQETEGLGSEYHIGPSYFLKLERPNGVCDFSRLWNDYLEGIIFEYLRGREDTNEALDRIKKVYLTEKTAFFDLEPKSGKLSVTNSNDWSKVFNND